MGEQDAAQVSGISFWRSYFEASQILGDAQRLRFYDSLFEFAFEGVQPDFSDDVGLRLCWTLVEPNVRSSIESRVNGRKGGRPKKEQQE